MSLLPIAIKAGQLEAVKELIEAGIDINETAENGGRPIHYASILGNEEIIKILMDNGAMYNCTDNHKWTPLYVSGSKSISELLKNTKEFFSSVKNNDIANVNSLIGKGICVNVKDASNASPLHYATWKGHYKVAKLLIENGGNPNSIGKNGFTPLHYASKFNNYDIVKLLLENGAVYNSLSSNGKTPLELAEDKDCIRLLKLIDICFKNVHNSKCDDVLEEMRKIRNSDIVKAVTKAKDTDKKTLLSNAICNKFTKLKQLYQTIYGDPEIYNNFNLNPLFTKEEFDKALHGQIILHDKLSQYKGFDDVATLEAEDKIPKILLTQNKHQEAYEICQNIYQKRVKAFGADNLYSLRTRALMAEILHFLGHDLRSLDIFDDVYNKQLKLLGKDNLEVLSTLTNMAGVLSSLQMYKKALDAAQTVYKTILEKFGPNDTRTVFAQCNVGRSLMSLCRYDEAISIFTAVYNALKERFGSLNAETQRVLGCLNAALYAKDKSPEAMEGMKEVLKVQKNNLGPMHNHTLNAENMLCDALFADKKFKEVIDILGENIQEKKSFLGENHPCIMVAKRLLEESKYCLVMQGLGLLGFPSPIHEMEYIPPFMRYI